MKIFQFAIGTTHKRDEQFFFFNDGVIDPFFLCVALKSLYNIYSISCFLLQVWWLITSKDVASIPCPHILLSNMWFSFDY